MLNAVDLSGAGIVDLSAMLRRFIDQEFSEGERRQVGEARACLVRKSPEVEQVFAPSRYEGFRRFACRGACITPVLVAEPPCGESRR